MMSKKRITIRTIQWIFLWNLLLCCPLSITAQNEGISISFKDKTLKEALDMLGKATTYSFAYQSEILPPDYRINRSFENQKIQDILSEILKGTGIEFKILDEQIILKVKKRRRTYSLSGYLNDAESGQKLIGVNIFNKQTKHGTTTNDHGYFSLSLPEGIYTIVFSYIGMKTVEKQMVFNADNVIQVDMSPNMELEEVVIYGAKQESFTIKENPSGKLDVSIEKMENAPAVMGEPDPVKFIQLLPGIQSGVEATGAIYVRGGGPLQNLFLLDNVPIYNAFHLLGLYSVFNKDVIGQTEVYKSGFPAKHGGRLSSILDMKTREGDFNRIKGNVSLGMISSKLAIEGPLIKDKTSFSLGGRLGYYYLYGVFIPKEIGGDKNIDNYNFYDFNARITHKLSPKSKIYLSVYTGLDIGEKIEKNFRDEYIDSERRNYLHSKEVDGQDWNNILRTIGWAGNISNNLFANIQVATSNYQYNGYQSDTLYRIYDTDTSSLSWKTNLDNSIRNNFFRSDFEYDLNSTIKMDFGYKYSQMKIESENSKKDHFSSYDGELTQVNSDTVTAYYDHSSCEHNPYVNLKISFTPGLVLTSGIHGSFYNTDEYSNNSFQPRVSAIWEVIPDLIVKGGYSKMAQHLHLLNVTRIKRASDLIVAAVDKAPSETSDHFSLGFSWLRFRDYKIHIDGYYKVMDNLINLKEGASYFTGSNNWQDKIVSGQGTSRGIELLIEKPSGKLSGWIGYSLSQTDRKFDELNRGEAFPFRYEHRHHANLVANYLFNDKWSFSVNFLIHSGNKETIPGIMYWSMDGFINKQFGTEETQSAIFYNQKNQFVNPCYHRMDVALKYTTMSALGESTWSLSIYNVYNHKNVFSSSYGEKWDSIIGNVSYKTRIINQEKYYGIIPTVSYTLKF